MKYEKEIRAKLKELQDFCKKEDYTLEEMQGDPRIKVLFR